MDHGSEAVIRFVAARGRPFELFELAEEILDEMPPLIDLCVDLERFCAPWMLRNHDLGAALVELFDNPVRIESFIGNQPLEREAFDERGNAHRVITMPWQKLEAHEVTECIG